MGGSYERSIYNQLMEVMGRLDAVEKDLRNEKTEHKEDVERLSSRISDLTLELARKQGSRPIPITAGKKSAAVQADRKGGGSRP